jgi:hypothetical protein
MLSSRAQSQRKFALTFCNGTAVCEVFIQSVKKVIFLLTNKLERKMKKSTRFQIYPSICSVKSLNVNNYLSPLKAENSLALQISSQLLSCSQVGSGFFSALLRLTPPVKRNISSWYSISFLAL